MSGLDNFGFLLEKGDTEKVMLRRISPARTRSPRRGGGCCSCAAPTAFGLRLLVLPLPAPALPVVLPTERGESGPVRPLLPGGYSVGRW